MREIPEDVRERALTARNKLCVEDEDCQCPVECPCLDVLEALILSEREAARAEAVRGFAEAILHGDTEHRGWLLEAANNFIAGEAMPAPRGGGLAAAILQEPKE